MNAVPLPALPDLASAVNYLSRVPLANPAQAIPALCRLYESLIAHPLPPKPFLQLLEQARTPLTAVLEAHAKRFHGKAVPLGDVEEEAFRLTRDTWLLAARAYARCAQGNDRNDAEHSDRIAVILHRCLHYTGLAIHEHFLARRELPPGIWLDLFGYYASAEEWGIANRPVPDPQAPSQTTHCTAALITVLLTDLAGPYSFGVRDINLIRRWAALWSPLVSVHHASRGDSLPEYVVDLTQDIGLKFSKDLTPNNTQRRLDTSRLAIQISQAQLQLKQRVQPLQLGLGHDVSSGQCQAMLDTLARPWTQASSPRRFRRRQASGVAQTTTGFEAIHYCISGEEFRQPDSVRQYSRQEYEALFAFRHQVDPTSQLEIRKRELDFPVDEWQVLNHSATGFRLERTATGQKVAHGQLIGIKPPDGERMLLAQVHWLMQAHDDGGLVAGVGVLPGSPVAIAARATGVNVSTSEPYSRAFRLPELTAMHTQATLVLPTGWFQIGRVIEVYEGAAWRARLTGIIDKGADFEHVSFAVGG